MFPQNVIIGADAIFTAPGIFVFRQVYAGINHDPLPHLPARHIGAEPGNFTGNVGTAPVGHLKIETWPSSSDPDVQKIECAGAHPNQHFPRPGFGIGHIAIFYDIQFTVFFEVKRFHSRTPPHLYFIRIKRLHPGFNQFIRPTFKTV